MFTLTLSPVAFATGKANGGTLEIDVLTDDSISAVGLATVRSRRQSRDRGQSLFQSPPHFTSTSAHFNDTFPFSGQALGKLGSENKMVPEFSSSYTLTVTVSAIPVPQQERRPVGRPLGKKTTLCERQRPGGGPSSDSVSLSAGVRPPGGGVLPCRRGSDLPEASL